MKKHLLLASFWMGSLITNEVNAAPDTLFRIPDTICAGNLVTPEMLIRPTEGNSFDWKFCSPPLALPPTGVNLGNTLYTYSPQDIAITRDEHFFVGWVINRNEGLVRWNFREGIEEMPIVRSYGNLENTLPEVPNGIELVKDNDKWYIFVIGGTNADNSTIARYSFDGNMHGEMRDSVNLGDLGGVLDDPRKLFIGKDGDNFIGFTFNKRRELLRIEFGSDITSIPAVTNLGNIGGEFMNVSSINAIREGDNWHIHVTDRGANALIKLTFGTSLMNTPFAINYSRLEGQLNYPHGLAIVPDCMEYYGYVINNVGSHLNTLYWEESVADTATAWNNGNIGAMSAPTAMSQFLSDSGRLYLFVTNSDSTITRLRFDNCGSASYAGSNEHTPPPFTYYTPGNYNVYLTVDQGLPTVRSYCKQITVVAAPDVQYSNDTLICVGDTIRLQTLYSEIVPITWSPDYNISALDQKVVEVWPQYSTTYVSTVPFYQNCTLRKEFDIIVSQIAADAGADRTINDGNSTILGGPMTSLGDQYTYNWFPTDFLTASNSHNITSAKPAQSITYYLEVSNTDGCYAIDSVNVTVPCLELSLPNAFVPEGKTEGTAIFKIVNEQIVKLNSFKIFDRWGNLVFSTLDVNQGWDGRNNGKDAPMGVYVWEVDGFCRDGFRIRKNGNVTLIR